MEKYCFGIDIGGTTIKIGLFRTDGELVEEWRIPTRVGNNGQFFYDDAAASIKDKMKERGITLEEVRGVGIDIPGPVREDGSIGIGSNIGTTDGYPAKEISARLSGIRSKVTNDANAAGLGECWMGAGKGCSSLVLVTLGTGVGGAVIVDGKIIAGIHGTGGEIGHITVEPDEKEACGCGNHGCLEQYASATGIVRVAKRLVCSGDPMEPVDSSREAMYPNCRVAAFGDALTAKDVCDLARDGDVIALRALDFSMDCLGRILASLMYVTDPEIFVIGGGVAEAGDILLDMLREKIRKYIPLCGTQTAAVVPAKLGNKAGIYGAAALVL